MEFLDSLIKKKKNKKNKTALFEGAGSTMYFCASRQHFDVNSLSVRMSHMEARDTEQEDILQMLHRTLIESGFNSVSVFRCFPAD